MRARIIETNLLVVDYLTADGQTYEISVSLPESAGIRTGAELVVEEIDGSSYKEEALNVLTVNDNSEVGKSRFFQIKIVKDGEELALNDKVEISIKLKDQNLDADTQVVQFAEQGSPELLDNNVDENTTKFESETLGVYGVYALRTNVQTVEGKNYTVTMTYGADADIPEGAELHAVEVSNKAEMADGTKYADAAAEKLGVTDTESVKLFDIFLLNGEEKIQPKAAVNVKIELNDAKAVDDTAVVHFAENGLDVLDKSVDNGNISFETDGFSMYAIVGTESITFEHIDSKGTRYEVTVTFGPDAKIPEGSWLRVTDIEDNTKAYEDARNAVLADKKEKDEFVDIDDFNLAALDISIIDPSGQEIEPEAAVTVDIKINDLPGVDNLDEIKESLEIQHHVEVADGVVIDKVFDGSVEGSYEMDTDDNIAKAGTVVDPTSVSDEDFRINDTYEEDALDASFYTEVFSTFTITWRNGGRSVTVHYVDESGNELNIDNPAATYPNMNANSDSPAFLIYDIDGYEYSYTYRNTNTSANRIAPELTKNNNNRWQYLNTNGGGATELSNNDNIYVVYSKKTDPTTGGTPEIDDASSSDWPQGPATPQFSKSSTNNTDGTNTVSLSISGGEKDYEKSTKANVIVVFDRSGSMSNSMGWNQGTRLERAQTAVNTMANTLLNGDITGVKMALVSFSTSTSIVQGFTDNYTTYQNAVNALTANGGTNWEQALTVANRMAVDSDAATFIVFVTDGDPTFRISRGDVTNGALISARPSGSTQNRSDMYSYYGTYTYYLSDSVFGDGNNDYFGRNFDYATSEVKSILANNKSFYAIGVSSDVTKVQNLVDEAGGGTAFLATDADALEEAFANITQSIKTTLGFGDVEITDGITELSNVEMKMMHEVDPDSFTYYKVTSLGQTPWDPASEGAGLASYDEETGAVKWDLGEGFQLEDGVTYMVTFRVWPSQDAYDLIADLNNGVKVYASGQPNSITADEREQIKELNAPTATSQGRYTLKTNTETVNATYSQTSSTGGTVTVSGETGLTADYHEGTIQDMDLESMKLTVKKVFEDDLTSGEDRETEVKLILKRRNAHQEDEEQFVPYAVPQTSGMSSEIVLNEGNNWIYSFYVAPGFEVDGEVLEHGYDFTISEPDIDYHYGLIEEIINPMVVDGQDVYYGDGELINGETIEQYTDQSLTAVNRVKSGIDIKKHVFDVDGTTEIYPETEFTITGQLLGPDGQPYTWQDGDSVDASGAYHKYDKNGNRIVYKGHFADSSNITFTLKAGERIRFINVPDGCTFQFTESTSGMDALGYQWMSTDAVTQHRTGPGEDFVTTGDVQPVVSGQTATLDTGVVGNKQYAITYGNKRTIELPDVELVKVDQDDNTKKLNDAEFTLYSDEKLTNPVTVDGNGNPISIKTGNKEGSTGPDGWYHIGLLPAGTYYLVETTEPDNYVLDETPIIITVTKGTNNYTVTATKDDESVLTGPTDGLYTITVDNEINLTEAEADKAWKNADGSTTPPTGASVVYTLYADGEVTEYTVTLDGTDDEVPEGTAGYESEGWKATFVNLPKYKFVNGEKTAIVYSIKETTTYPGYTASTTDPVANGGTITNTQETTSANANKAWENADGTTTAPEGATVDYTLYADGTATSYTVTLDGAADTAPTGTAGYESTGWKAEFINLPKYKIVEGEAVAIEYTIAETTTYPGYTKSPEDAVASGGTITNKQGSTETYALKAWKNADGSTEAPDGATVVFTLYQDGTATNYKVTLDGTVDTTVPTGTGGYESEAWKATFVKLPQYKIVDGEAVAITYTIAETTTYPGYTASSTDPVGSGSTITNTQDETSANALKAWKNADGTTTAPQGGKVTYTLYADGSATTNTVTLDGTAETAPDGTGGYESEDWKAEFVHLPKYQTGTTTAIVYTIAETTGYPGYTASTDEPVASGSTITNTQEATEVNAIKAWKNADGTITPPAGATVEFTLYADDIATEYTVTLDGTAEETVPTGTAGYESESWKALFKNLPKYKLVEGEEGEIEAVEIVYTVGESQGYAGYTATPEEPVASGETITNTQDDIDVYATKAWLNADGTDTAPEDATVVFTLLADGVATEHTVTLDGAVDEEVPEATGGYESEAWKATFVNLPKYKANGITEIEYTIAETTGYETYEMIPETAVESGGEITNKQITTVIQIKKIGDWTATKTLSGVQFKLFSDEDCEHQIMSDSTGASFGPDGIITTGSDGTVTIGALIPGTYYLQEVKTADGYNLLDEVVAFTIKADGTIEYSTGNTTFEVQNGGAFYELEDGGYGIYINNPSGTVLPHTGGPGTLIYTLSGLILLTGSVIGLSMRRRERRLN